MLPDAPADSDVRPTKRRRASGSPGQTEVNQIQIGPAQPPEGLGTWRAVPAYDPAFSPDMYRTSNINDTSGLAAPCPPGGLYSTPPTELARFDQIHAQHWLGTPGQDVWALNTSLSDGEPQSLSSRDATPVSEHALWTSPALSAVRPLAAGSLLPPQWPGPWVPAALPTLVDSQEQFDQRPVSASYYSPTSFPSRALFVGTEPHPFLGLAPNPDDGNPRLAARQEEGYGNGASNSQSAYQASAEALNGLGSLGDIPTPKFDQVGYFPAHTVADGRQTPTSMPHSVPVGSGAAQSQIRGREPDGLHSLVIGQPNNGVRIKKESWENFGHGGWDGWGYMRPEIQQTLSAHVTEDVPQSGHDPDGEGPLDRKKRRPFKERARMQTSNTRNMGACLRCHAQRVRVSDDLVWIAYDNHQTLTLQSASRTSKIAQTHWRRVRRASGCEGTP